ncbi:MAG: hypothetical protein M1834_006187 [Cirrosporium novae-zelandiae]|nr:MAG: hypothetical protein M1834_006187 [Cirrosporium novae-zelandiae]
MANQVEDAVGEPILIGYIYQQENGQDVQATDEMAAHLEIYSGKEVLIGRDNGRCQLVLNDPVISNKHVRIYSILFERNNVTEIAPLIYAEDLSRNGTYWNNSLIGKGTGGVLLSDGDLLRVSPRITLKFCTELESPKEHWDPVQEQEKKSIEDRYVITDRKLGAGAFGKVYMAIDHSTKRQLACKIVDLRKLQQEYSDDFEDDSAPESDDSTPIKQSEAKRAKIWAKKDLRRRRFNKYNREVDILIGLCHPNIIAIEKVFKTKNALQLITAGDLFSYLEYKGGCLQDVEVAVIVRQIVLAVKYLHDKDIVHRDLKPDNILITSLIEGSRIVLTDFGAARFIPKSKMQTQRMQTVLGTLDYTAPEIHKTFLETGMLRGYKGYTKSVDMWSLGSVTAVLFTGESFFQGSEDAEYKDNPAKALRHLQESCDPKTISGPRWRNASKRAKDFVKKLLVFNEAQRMAVQQALDHEWFTNAAHKAEFEAVYKRAIPSWKPRVPKEQIIEKLRGPLRNSFPSHKTQTSKRKASRIAMKPIEPHYRPYYSYFNKLASPRSLEKTNDPLIREGDLTDDSMQSMAKEAGLGSPLIGKTEYRKKLPETTSLYDSSFNRQSKFFTNTESLSKISAEDFSQGELSSQHVPGNPGNPGKRALMNSIDGGSLSSETYSADENIASDLKSPGVLRTAHELQEKVPKVRSPKFQNQFRRTSSFHIFADHIANREDFDNMPQSDNLDEVRDPLRNPQDPRNQSLLAKDPPHRPFKTPTLKRDDPIFMNSTPRDPIWPVLNPSSYVEDDDEAYPFSPFTSTNVASSPSLALTENTSKSNLQLPSLSTWCPKPSQKASHSPTKSEYTTSTTPLTSKLRRPFMPSQLTLRSKNPMLQPQSTTGGGKRRRRESIYDHDDDVVAGAIIDENTDAKRRSGSGVGRTR